MTDIWKAALEWYIYLNDPVRKRMYADCIMAIKQDLVNVQSIMELRDRYPTERGTAERVVERLYPGDWRLEHRSLEVAYALRCLEFMTGKPTDLRKGTPSLWVLETVA